MFQIAPRRFSAEFGLGVSPPSRCFYPPLAFYGLLVTWLGRGLGEIGIQSPWEPRRPDILKLILGQKGYLLAGLLGIAIGLILSAISAPMIARFCMAFIDYVTSSSQSR